MEETVNSFLNYVVLKNPVINWISAAACIVGGLIAGKILSWIVSNVLKKISVRTKSRIDDIILAVIKKPLVLLVFLFGVSLGIKFLHMGDLIDLWIDRVFSIAMVLVMAYTIEKLAGAIITEYVPTNSDGRIIKDGTEIQPILKKFLSTLIWILAFVMILKILGYNINAILAGLGLGGAAIALASKDTLANFFGSITVFVDRPFKMNDRIKISGFDGYITEMGMRTSRLKTLDNHIVIIPNSIFASTPIVNISSEPNTRVTQAINISKDNNLQQVEASLALIKTICSDCPGIDGNIEAGVIGVSGPSYQISFIFFVSKDAPYLETVNRVNIEIIKKFEEAGIKLA